MLVDFFDRHRALAAQRTSLANRLNELVTTFREGGQPIIWIRQEFAPDLSDAFLEMRRTGTRVTIAGTEGARLLPELDWKQADHVIVKKRYSAFFRTPLDDLLSRLEVKSLVVAGINTHACVRMTVIDAYQRDYEVVLASQCIGSHDARHDEVTRRYLEGKMARGMSNLEIRHLVFAAAA